MTEIRVLLVHMPVLLREIVRTVLDSQQDLRVVAELTESAADPAVVLASSPADVIVGGAESPALTVLVAARPAMPIVLVAADGREGFVCRPTGELSAETLLDTVRSTASAHGRPTL